MQKHVGHNHLKLKGREFGALLALEPEGYDKGKNIMWLCLCLCGEFKLAIAAALNAGQVKSCGCGYTRHKAKDKWRLEHDWDTRRQKAHVYHVWRDMHRRCYAKDHKDFQFYGAIGVEVAREWHDFNQFLEDMGYPLNHGKLKRIDLKNNFEKGNVVWVVQ